MLRRFVLAMTVAAGLCFVGSHAMAQDATDYTKGEQKCEASMGKSLSKEVQRISNCVAMCLKAQRAAAVPDYSTCLALPPTDPCITDLTKGPKAKAQVSIGKKCDPGLGKDCPACFPASTVPLGPISCSTGQPMPDRTEGLTLATGQTFYCIEAGALTPTPEEAKCEDRATKEAVKFVGALTKCTDKCTKNAQAGKIAYDACAPANGAPGVTPNDPDTQDCIGKAFDKFADKINAVCFGAALPACYPADPLDLLGLTFTIVQNVGQYVFCGSPSDAFID